MTMATQILLRLIRFAVSPTAVYTDSAYYWYILVSRLHTQPNVTRRRNTHSFQQTEHKVGLHDINL